MTGTQFLDSRDGKGWQNYRATLICDKYIIFVWTLFKIVTFANPIYQNMMLIIWVLLLTHFMKDCQSLILLLADLIMIFSPEPLFLRIEFFQDAFW